MNRRRHMLVALVIAMAALILPAAAQPVAKTGVVVMHGKGGRPERFVSDLALVLERKGHLVANLEMPWSGRREYDKNVDGADQEVSAAIAGLRAQGAQKVFIAGHSQGGVYALHYASRFPVDGAILIAPGGDPASLVFRNNLGDNVARARGLVAANKGNEPVQFEDYEGSRGKNQVRTTAAIYLTWFDPDGAMNQRNSTRAIPPQTPVLYIAPSRDYPGLQKIKQVMFDLLPAHPLTRLYEPDASHLESPGASADEIARWVTEVAAAAKN